VSTLQEYDQDRPGAYSIRSEAAIPRIDEHEHCCTHVYVEKWNYGTVEPNQIKLGKFSDKKGGFFLVCWTSDVIFLKCIGAVFWMKSSSMLCELNM
jgi:hypothetical protein